MLGRRRARAGLTALLLVLVTACGGATPSSPGGDSTQSDQTSASPTSGSQTTEAAPPSESQTTEATPLPPATEPVTEAGPSPQVETDGPEPPVAGGDDGVSIELAGLPVGAGGAVDLGGSWCGVFFWGESLPAGVELRITHAATPTVGAAILDQPCGDAPPCPGTTISLEAPEQGCGVTVVPPSPDVPLVLVRLDGVVHCQDPATCEGLVLASGATAALENPNGGFGTDGDGDGTDGDGTDGEGTGDGTDTGTDTGEDPGSPGTDSDESTAGPDGG